MGRSHFEDKLAGLPARRAQIVSQAPSLADLVGWQRAARGDVGPGEVGVQGSRVAFGGIAATREVVGEQGPSGLSIGEVGGCRAEDDRAERILEPLLALLHSMGAGGDLAERRGRDSTSADAARNDRSLPRQATCLTYQKR